MEKEKFYKRRYLICFYDIEGELPLYSFDNVIQILKFQKKEITRQNVNIMNNYVYNANKRPNHFCKFLTGEPMTCYLIDMKEEKGDF